MPTGSIQRLRYSSAAVRCKRKSKVAIFCILTSAHVSYRVSFVRAHASRIPVGSFCELLSERSCTVLLYGAMCRMKAHKVGSVERHQQEGQSIPRQEPLGLPKIRLLQSNPSLVVGPYSRRHKTEPVAGRALRTLAGPRPVPRPFSATTTLLCHFAKSTSLPLKLGIHTEGLSFA